MNLCCSWALQHNTVENRTFITAVSHEVSDFMCRLKKKTLMELLPSKAVGWVATRTAQTLLLFSPLPLNANARKLLPNVGPLSSTTMKHNFSYLKITQFQIFCSRKMGDDRKFCFKNDLWPQSSFVIYWLEST